MKVFKCLIVSILVAGVLTGCSGSGIESKESTMETVHFKDITCHVAGPLPVKGDKAPEFLLVGSDLSDVKLSDYAGKNVVLNIFPSIDTGVCAMSVRNFNKRAASIEDAAVVCISMDLPFAASRFCAAEGIDNVTVASAFRSPEFVEKYGVKIVDGPLAGLLCRAVIVIDKQGNVVYRQLVEQIATEPDYDGALAAIASI